MHLTPIPPETPWPAPPAFPEWPRNDLHVWRICLAPDTSDAGAPQEVLDPDERARAARFRAPAARRRFEAARAALRHILGGYLGIDPRHVPIDYGEAGKPRLSPDAALPPKGRGEPRLPRAGTPRAPLDAERPRSPGPALRFNLSHSQDLALCVVGAAQEVGIDVEAPKPLRDVERLVARHFCPSEAAWWSRLPDPERLGGFYRVWTRKEALLKVSGLGLSRPLERVDSARGLVDDVAFWVGDLAPGEGFYAAVARESEPAAIRCWSSG